LKVDIVILHARVSMSGFICSSLLSDLEEWSKGKAFMECDYNNDIHCNAGSH